MRYYYYILNMSGTKEQYYIELDKQGQNTSVAKVKNAIAKKAVIRVSQLIGTTNNENIKQLEKAIKSNIYDTSTLLEGYNNIEVTGNFNKTESKTVIFQNLITDTKTKELKYIDAEGEKVNSKVYPNLNIYLAKNDIGKGYKLIYEGLQIGYTRTKNIKEIEESLQKMNMSESELIIKMDERLIQLGVKEQITIVESDTTEVIENNTIEAIDDINIIATTNKDNNINVVSDSIKLPKIDINNNIFNPNTISKTGSFCNTG